MAESKAKPKVATKTVAAAAKPKVATKPKVAKPAVAESAVKAKPKAVTKAEPKLAAKLAAPAKKAPAKTKASVVDAEAHYRMVAEAAYYIAEKRGFAPGNHSADWAQAEAQIAVLHAKK